MTQTVVNIRFAAVTLEAGRTDAPEAPEAIDDLATTFILAGVTETRVNLVLTRVAMKTRQTGADELLEASLFAGTTVRAGICEARITLSHHCRVCLLDTEHEVAEWTVDVLAAASQ